MFKSYTLLPVLLVAAAPWHGETREFSAFNVFIEINATDGDAGFQGMLDGEPWKRVKIKDPCGRTVFQLQPKRTLRERGVTEFFWESAEPPFDEAPLEEFLARFRPGEYEALGKTNDGVRLASTAMLTHHLPDGPVITSPEEDEPVDPDEDLLVTWNAVTTQYSQDGPGAGPPLEGPIVSYIVTCDTTDDGVFKRTVIDVFGSTSATVPADFLEPDRHWKVEIGANEESGNSTFRELEFCTHEEECPEVE